ncbi:MAG: hypothetical protein AAFX52_08675 [Pseudomonadota bacterium]
MTEKTLGNNEASGTRANVPDTTFFGDGDTWKLICKASSQSEGWMKSTKAMEVVGGCVVQVTTQQHNPDGSYALAEAVTFVPGVSILEERETTEHQSRVISRTLVGA